LDFQKAVSLRTRGCKACFILVTDVFKDSLEISSAWQWCQRGRDHMTVPKMVNAFRFFIFPGSPLVEETFSPGCSETPIPTTSQPVNHYFHKVKIKAGM
jgi:hypothetical protein